MEMRKLEDRTSELKSILETSLGKELKILSIL